MNLRGLPKIELHLHLDCSLSYRVVSRIDPSVSRERYRKDFIGPVRCHDLAEYLARAEYGIRLMQTAEQLEWVTLDLMEQLRAENVLYAEIRFAPLLHTRKGMAPEEIVSVVDHALAKGIAATGVEARLILCTLRHFSESESLLTAQLAGRFRRAHVAGFDIAGDEAGYPVDAHIAAFRYARQQGISRTSHAGEARGADSVREVLRHFSPQRIGHGVRCSEDPRLVEELKASRIHLEVCPTSNLQTNMYDNLESHPVDQLYRQGLSLGINTDGRAISDTTLEEEYHKLAQAFNWKKEHFLQCNLYALEAAFLEEELKEQIRERLLTGFGKGVEEK